MPSIHVRGSAAVRFPTDSFVDGYSQAHSWGITSAHTFPCKRYHVYARPVHSRVITRMASHQPAAPKKSPKPPVRDDTAHLTLFEADKWPVCTLVRTCQQWFSWPLQYSTTIGPHNAYWLCQILNPYVNGLSLHHVKRGDVPKGGAQCKPYDFVKCCLRLAIYVYFVPLGNFCHCSILNNISHMPSGGIVIWRGWSANEMKPLSLVTIYWLDNILQKKHVKW